MAGEAPLDCSSGVGPKSRGPWENGLVVPHRWAALVLLGTLTLSSTWYVFKHVIQTRVEARREFVARVLEGNAEAPYQYRVLYPILGHALESALPTGMGVEWRHAAAWGSLVLACFAGIYGLFHAWLRTLFTPTAALLGTMMLALPIPLAVTGYFVEGDFLELLAYALGLWLMATGRDAWLPLVIGFGATNREQTVYLIVFYVAHLAAGRSLTDRRKQWVLAASGIAFLAGSLGVRIYYGPRPNAYGIAFDLGHNTSPRTLREAVLPLWAGAVLGTALLAAFSWRRTTRFFRLAFLALGPYLALFFLYGLLIELAKFLPAFLILIPMALQSLTGEEIREPRGT
jgi:hypothetical protein